jgi:preprotein translocase subunit SecF
LETGVAAALGAVPGALRRLGLGAALIFREATLGGLVVFFFMGNWRASVIAALAIPTSIIATFLMMRWAGFTINTITLLGLTVAVGIVIDDAIVVLENIFRYIEEKKYKPHDAAIAATQGLLALQLHSGGGVKMRWRNILIEPLSLE